MTSSKKRTLDELDESSESIQLPSSKKRRLNGEISNDNQKSQCNNSEDNDKDSNSKIKLKDLNDDINDKNKIFVGGLCQIYCIKKEENPIEYWNESNIRSVYDDSLQKTVGMIESIFPHNKTIEMRICNDKNIIVPIKAVKSIIYETNIPKTQELLISNYIHTEMYNQLIPRKNRNIPPLVNNLCHSYYSNDLILIAEEDSNKTELTITREQCKLSSFLSSAISLNNNIKTLYIKCTSYRTLESIVPWIKHHNGIKPAPLPCPVRSIHMSMIVKDKWDATYIDSFSKKEVFSIILLVNMLGIDDLVHLGCAKIATLIKQLDQKEINRIIDEEEKKRRSM